jgi:hypothetical protein
VPGCGASPSWVLRAGDCPLRGDVDEYDDKAARHRRRPARRPHRRRTPPRHRAHRTSRASRHLLRHPPSTARRPRSSRASRSHTSTALSSPNQTTASSSAGSSPSCRPASWPSTTRPSRTASERESRVGISSSDVRNGGAAVRQAPLDGVLPRDHERFCRPQEAAVSPRLRRFRLRRRRCSGKPLAAAEPDRTPTAHANGPRAHTAGRGRERGHRRRPPV